jgi:hypothetical protein
MPQMNMVKNGNGAKSMEMKAGIFKSKTKMMRATIRIKMVSGN